MSNNRTDKDTEPGGVELRTLRDAPATTSPSLPKREHDTSAWLAAIIALMLVVEHGGDTTLPSIGTMQALYPGETAPTPRRKRKRKPAKRYWIVR